MERNSTQWKNCVSYEDTETKGNRWHSTGSFLPSWNVYVVLTPGERLDTNISCRRQLIPPLKKTL